MRARCGKRLAPSCPPWIWQSHPERKINARRRRNGETAVFGCFLKFEVAGSRQAFRAACSRFYQPAAAFCFRPKRPLQSEYFWDFWAFLQIGQLRCNKPPSPTPRGMHLATPARLGGRKSGLRRNPGPEGRCAKTQSVKVGALQ